MPSPVDGFSSNNFTLEREEDGIVLLTFVREERLNALNSETFRDLRLAADAVANDDAAQVLIMTGRGRAFVAGADINEYVDITLKQYLDFEHNGRAGYEAISRLRKPVIAAVNGFALGGGFELVLCADIVLAGAGVKMGLPESKLGLLPGGGGTQRLARVVGPLIAKEMLMTGEFFPAERLAQLGVVNHVHPRETLLDEARGMARLIMSRGPLAVRMAKQLVDHGLDASIEAGLTMEIGMTATLFVTDDAREGVAAFHEKRPAEFRGR